MNSEARDPGELTVQYLSVSDLKLDAENPRLPMELRSSTDQTALTINMAEIFDAIAVARSIARFGFYPWEALVVIPQRDSYIVVEGNRRLTALRGLLEASLRDQLDDPDAWRSIVENASRPAPEAVPCVVVQDRQDATPALGYRHISGIKPWEPQMQARFVAALVDRDNRTFHEVAELTGQSQQWVQETYRTFKVFETAEDAGVNTDAASDAYSLLTVALGTRELREHIGAERVIAEGGRPIAEPDPETLGELFEWVFGTDGNDPVASESREIRNLAKVVAKPAGLKAIRDGLSLEEAKQKVEDAEYDPLDVVRRDLIKAERTLNRVDLTNVSVEEDVLQLIDAVVEQAQRLLNETDAESG